MYEEIKQQFADVIEYSQSIPNPKVDLLFEDWMKSKEKFIKRFGGLIYEWPEPIEFTLDPTEQRKSAMEFAETVGSVYHNSDLAEFIDNNLDSFYDNVVSKSEIKEIPKGMKLIKAFKHFEKDEITLNKLQSIASQLIQENKVKGTLCFSVHPLDFLSSSENTYNWRSCHSLDGEFRAGNLSYMVDTTTFMVYLKGENEVKLNAFPGTISWNSKKWRMLIHAAENDEIMFAGRQYPFKSDGAMDIVLNIYNNIMMLDNPYQTSNIPYRVCSNKYDKWKNLYIENDPEGWNLDHKYLSVSRHLIELDEVVCVGLGALNYNDVLNSTCYKHPYYALLNLNHWHDVNEIKKHPIIVGGPVECLRCGKYEIEQSETMMCPDCEVRYGWEENDDYTHCESCGARLHMDDAYWVNDTALCENCFDNEAFVCSVCGDYYFNSEQHYIPAKSEDDYEEYVCTYCYEDYKNAKERI